MSLLTRYLRHWIRWLTNKYTYSWEGNPEWSRYYAGGKEIWTYYKKLANEWRVDRVTRFNSRLVRATWDPKLYRYDLEIEDTQTGEKLKDYAEVLINATGWLKCFPVSHQADPSSWKWPDIPGIESFKGDLFHTANWQEDYEYHGKTVAVIGSGSSAIQIVPQLQPRTFRSYLT